MGTQTQKECRVHIKVSKPPIIIQTIHDLTCSTVAEVSAIASSGKVYWYDSLTSKTPFFIGDDLKVTGVTSDTTYYVEAKNKGCTSNSRAEVYIVLEDFIPIFEVPKKMYYLPKNKEFVTLTTENPQGNYTYEWKKDTIIIPYTTSSIKVSTPGTYTVKAISNVGCSSEEKKIIVNDFL